MNRDSLACVDRLWAAGIGFEDALALRRISMTLHRWHELECGIDSGGVEREEAFAIERAAWPASDKARWWNGTAWDLKARRRTYSDSEKDSIMAGLPIGKPWTSEDYARANAAGFPSQGAWRATGSKPFWTYERGNGSRGRTPIADREAGAKKRLAKIMARYPALGAYIQGDPRGAALYILRPGDVPEGEHAESYYSRGIAVYK